MRAEVPEIVPIVVAATLLVILILLNLHLFRSGRRGPAAGPAAPRLLNCPVCGSKLQEGERVRTAAYPGKEERLVHIYGCPRCHGPHATLTRRCPVCKKRLKGEDHLVGRMITVEGRRQVKVWGCSECAAPPGRR